MVVVTTPSTALATLVSCVLPSRLVTRVGVRALSSVLLPLVRRFPLDVSSLLIAYWDSKILTFDSIPTCYRSSVARMRIRWCQGPLSAERPCRRLQEG